MRKESLKNLRLLTRWLILCGVLTGIFFSSGEGLQLMPFPDSPSGAARDAARLKKEKGKVYAFSVHSFPLSLSLKAKVQKNSDDLIRADRCAAEFAIDAVAVSAPSKFYFARTSFYASRAFLIPSGRAPPVA